MRVEVRDRGCGIADVRAARRPLYRTDPSGERAAWDLPSWRISWIFCV